MEAPLLAMEHDQELLKIILKNMSYAEILDFCNTNQRFRGLCSDPSSIVGQHLRQKRRKEVIAVFDTYHDVANQGFNISNLTLLSDRGRTRIQLPTTSPELISSIIQSINRKEAVAYALNDDQNVIIKTDMAVFEDPRKYASIVYAFDALLDIETFIDPDLLKVILVTALMGYDRNIEDNHYEILADYTARSPSIF